MPAPQATHVDPVLTNISVEYKNAEYVGKSLFPLLRTGGPAGTFVKFSKKNRFKIGRYVITAHSRAPQIDWVQTFDTFAVNYHAVGKPVSEIARQWAASGVGQTVSLEVYTTEVVKNTILLEFESIVSTLATTTSTYGTNHSTPAISWDETGATPITDLKAAIKACAKRPNTVIMGRDVMDVLSENSDILARIVYTERGIVTEEVLASLLQVNKVITADAQAEVGGDYLWGQNVVLAYVEANPGLESLTFAATFTPDGDDFIRRYPDPSLGRGAEVIESHWAYDPKIVAQDCGYLLNDVLAGS